MLQSARPLRRAMVCVSILVTLCVVPLSSTDAATTGCSAPCPAAAKLPEEIAYVSAVAADDAWVVGDNGNGKAEASHWNGTQWVSEPPVNLDVKQNELEAVDARAADDVWTVGYTSDDGGHTDDALIEHWDGTIWQVVPSPDTGYRQTVLREVSASAANDAWASGDTTSAEGVIMPITEHWDGSQWQVVPLPDGIEGTEGITDLQAISATDAWAIGNTFDKGARQGAAGPWRGSLILHWDGRAWSVVDRMVGSRLNQTSLGGIDAAAPDDVWAVGARTGQSNRTIRRGYPWIMHWDGTQWSDVSPKLRKPGVLEAVSVDRSGGVFAVGQWSHMLIMRFDGSRWIVDSAPPFPSHSYLQSVAAVAPDRAWAVGLVDDIGKTGAAAQLAATRTPLLSWDGASWHE